MPPWQLLDAIHKLVLPTCQSTVRREWQLNGHQFKTATDGIGRSETDCRPESCQSVRNPNALYILVAFIGAARKAVTAQELVSSVVQWKVSMLARVTVRVSEPRQRRIPDHPKWRSTRTRPRSLPPVPG